MQFNTNNKRKVIVLGKGSLAVKICNWFQKSAEYDLVLIVPVVPEPEWAVSLIGWARKNRIPFVKTGHYKDIPEVKNPDWQVDLVFSVFYDKIVKKWFIDKCDKILNVHNSPLPRYRGVNPINWALKNNEKEHGVTIHQIIPGIDCGPIMAQIKYSIYPSIEEVKDVYQKALDYGLLLFEKTMPFLDKINPQSQNDSLATYYSKKDKKKLGERRDFTKNKSRK